MSGNAFSNNRRLAVVDPVKLTNNQKRRLISERVEAALGSEVICSRCCATVATFSNVCTAEILDPCPGFLRIDEVRKPIEAEVLGFKAGASQ
jgi:hypothetical protein